MMFTRTALAAGLFSFSLAALAQSPISSSASISNLSFQTTDLKPSDLIAPKFTFSNPNQVKGALGAREASNDALFPGLSGYGTPFTSKLLPTENKSLTLLDGQVAVSANVNGDLSAQMNLSLSKANTLLVTQGGAVSRTRLPSEAIEGSAWNVNRNNSGPSATNWTISAYTSVLVSARISLDTGFDTSQLDQAALSNIYSAMLSADARAAIFVNSYSASLEISDGTSGYAGGGYFDYSLRSALDVASSGVLRKETWLDGTLVSNGSAPAYRDIQFTLTNNTASSVSGSFNYLAEGSNRMILSIPEPATWASFAMGLAFMAAAVIRGRKSNRCI